LFDAVFATIEQVYASARIARAYRSSVSYEPLEIAQLPLTGSLPSLPAVAVEVLHICRRFRVTISVEMAPRPAHV
jgi:hypothetical protein